MNNRYRIFWLEDQKLSIAYLVKYLQAQGDFSVEVFEESTSALTAINDSPPDLFIVDFLLVGDHDSDGLFIAKTAWEMRPTMQIVAVTGYLYTFAPQIASDLAEGKYPFAAIYEKDQLESLEAMKAFATKLRFLCQHEYHVGEVTKVEDDYAQVTLRTPKGDEYTRFFETEFLEACGIGKAGEGIELVFWKTADGKSGEVHMRLTKRTAGEDTVVKAKEIISKVDLGKIREKFGTQVDNS